MHIQDLLEAPSYDSAEHIGSGIEKAIKYAGMAAAKFKSGYKDARVDKQLDARDVMTKTETATKRLADKAAAKEKASAQAQAGEGAPAIVSSIIIGKYEPSEKDIDTFDFFDVSDLAIFQKSLTDISATFENFPEALKKALGASDLIDAKDKKSKIDSYTTVPVDVMKKIKSRIELEGFNTADTSFWSKVLAEKDLTKIGKLAIQRISELRAENMRLNAADKPDANGKKIFRAEGSLLAVKMMAHWQVLNDRLNTLQDLTVEAAKRPRKDPADEDDINESLKKNIRILLKKL